MKICVMHTEFFFSWIFFYHCSRTFIKHFVTLPCLQFIVDVFLIADKIPKRYTRECEMYHFSSFAFIQHHCRRVFSMHINFKMLVMHVAGVHGKRHGVNICFICSLCGNCHFAIVEWDREREGRKGRYNIVHIEIINNGRKRWRETNLFLAGKIFNEKFERRCENVNT